jgi:hypothetical protein
MLRYACYTEKIVQAEAIRRLARERYVVPARQKKVKRFSIRAGDVERELQLRGRTANVCSALKTRQFLEQNGLRLVGSTGPESGQSTTVTYTYEFIDSQPPESRADAWRQLRGALSAVFETCGGGEAYLQEERNRVQV